MKLRAAMVAGALALIAAPTKAQTVADGISAWQQKDYATAIAIWKPLADRGDADASFNLGQAYRLGRGVPLDLAEAQGWLERAARKGHSDAQSTLGLLLFDSGNRTAGLRWLRMAADQGDARALLVYGTALFNGDGVPSDPVRAYAYVSRAAAQGLAPAQSTLDQMDGVLTVEQRRKGVAMAMEMAKVKAARPAAATPPKASAARPTTPKSAPVARKPSNPTPDSPLTGRWRVQLGAFSKKASAESLYRRLATAKPLSGRQAYYIPAGKVTRLQVGPYPDKAAATAACAALKASGQACFPVAP